MRQSEMTPDQREAKRLYDRKAKQRQRQKQKEERLRSVIPNAWDYAMPDQQQERLDEYTLGVTKTIAAELGLKKLSEKDLYIVDGVASVLFGLETGITQVVNDPEGILVGGHFPDAAASETIEHVHRFPQILQSATFSDLYVKFLHQVVKWAKRNELYADREHIRELKQEIAGDYVLTPLPEPKPEPPKTIDEPLPSMAEILERGRIELLTRWQPQDPNISPDAQRYLDHGPTRR